MKLRKSMRCLALLKSPDAFISYSRDFKLAENYPPSGTYFPFSRKIWPNLAKLQFFTEFFTLYKLCFSEDSLEFDSWGWNQCAPSPVHTTLNSHYSLGQLLFALDLQELSGILPAAEAARACSGTWQSCEVGQLYPVLTGTCEEWKGWGQERLTGATRKSPLSTQKRVRIF